MKLLVDLGNTRIKWAWLAGGDLVEPGAVAHAGTAPAILADLLAGGRAAAEVRVSSVAATDLAGALAAELRRTTGAPVRWARTGLRAAGVRNGYREPRQLGVDRWLAMAAAFARFRCALCVVDAGTAWTADFVDADGAHQGGLILPGPALMRAALLGATGGIAAATVLRPGPGEGDGDWGRDTEACMRIGARRAGACLVESCVNACGPQRGPPPLLVLTGGDAADLLGTLALPAQHRPLLVLEGLALPDIDLDP